jgi:hypothetical protein
MSLYPSCGVPARTILALSRLPGSAITLLAMGRGCYDRDGAGLLRRSIALAALTSEPWQRKPETRG